MRFYRAAATFLAISSPSAAAEGQTLNELLSGSDMPSRSRDAPNIIRIGTKLDAAIHRLTEESLKDGLERSFCIESSPFSKDDNKKPNIKRVHEVYDLTSSNEYLGASDSVQFVCSNVNSRGDFHTHPDPINFVPSPTDIYRLQKSKRSVSLISDLTGNVSIIVNTVETVSTPALEDMKPLYSAVFVGKLLRGDYDPVSEQKLSLAIMCHVKKQLCYFRQASKLNFEKIDLEELITLLVKNDKYGLLPGKKQALDIYRRWAINRIRTLPDRNVTKEPISALIDKALEIRPTDLVIRQRDVSTFMLGDRIPSFDDGVAFAHHLWINWDTLYISTGIYYYVDEQKRITRRPDLDRFMCAQFGLKERARFKDNRSFSFASFMWLDIDRGDIETVCWDSKSGEVVLNVKQTISGEYLVSDLESSLIGKVHRSDLYKTVCIRETVYKKRDDCKALFDNPTQVISHPDLPIKKKHN